ncbi:hypothetical protein GQ53DRAFT_532448 [Thozetella sp. PMI_491]|nr:hypothetical protein GQ53DRAFT_532448 [Thozetella sp. PMI_491]
MCQARRTHSCQNHDLGVEHGTYCISHQENSGLMYRYFGTPLDIFCRLGRPRKPIGMGPLDQPQLSRNHISPGCAGLSLGLVLLCYFVQGQAEAQQTPFSLDGDSQRASTAKTTKLKSKAGGASACTTMGPSASPRPVVSLPNGSDDDICRAIGASGMRDFFGLVSTP